MIPRVWACTAGRMELPLTEMRKIVGGASLGGRMESLVASM